MSNHRIWTLGSLFLLLVLGYSVFRFVSSTYAIDRLVEGLEQRPAEDAAGKKHVVLIAQELDNPFWRTVETGAREAAAQRGMSIDYRGPFRIHPDEQLNLLESAIASKPDAILMQGIGVRRCEELVRMSAEHGIPVIMVDADQPSSQRLAYVGTDNRAAGRRMGMLVAKAAQGGRIGVIIGSELSDNQRLRLEGFRAVIEQAPGFAIAAVGSSNISRLQAATQTQAILKQHPEITTMVGLSALDGVGIVEGLKAVDRENVTVYAFDDLRITKQEIDQGTITASIVQQPREIGFRAASLLADYFAGGSIPKLNYIDTDQLDRDNLNASADR